MESLTPPRAFEISDAQEAKGAAADEKVSALEAKLEELYKARAGHAKSPWWAWCARCGKRGVHPARPDEYALVNPGKNRTTQVCPECDDELRREKESAELAKRDGVAEVCPRCEESRPNVGPWDGTGGFSRLCGGCKAVVALEALAQGRANV